jgi:hypothetical protein
MNNLTATDVAQTLSLQGLQPPTSGLPAGDSANARRVSLVIPSKQT